MPRQPLITRPRKFTIHIPEDVAVRLELFLHSTALGRVPQGALGKFVMERTIEYLDRMAAPQATIKKELMELHNLALTAAAENACIAFHQSSLRGGRPLEQTVWDIGKALLEAETKG